MKTSMLGAKPHSKVPKMKAPTPPKSTGLLPMVSASRP